MNETTTTFTLDPKNLPALSEEQAKVLDTAEIDYSDILPLTETQLEEICANLKTAHDTVVKQ